MHKGRRGRTGVVRTARYRISSAHKIFGRVVTPPSAFACFSPFFFCLWRTADDASTPGRQPFLDLQRADGDLGTICDSPLPFRSVLLLCGSYGSGFCNGQLCFRMSSLIGGGGAAPFTKAEGRCLFAAEPSTSTSEAPH
eukprot:1316772-Pleurochrysis_carterae.AAC.1